MTGYWPAVVLILATVIMPIRAYALESATQTTPYATYRLISATDTTGHDAQVTAALDIQLKPGWHSYWRMPGEGGLPPSFDWTDSKNVRAVAVRWPAPHRFQQLGMESFGYRGDVVLPLIVTLKKAAAPVSLSMKASIMVCNDICIPQHVALSLAVPSGSAQASGDVQRIKAALDTVPHKGNIPALKIEGAVVGPKALVVRVWSRDGFAGVDLFAETAGVPFSFTAKPVVVPDKADPRGATLSLVPPVGTENMAAALMHRQVTLTLVKGRFAIEKTVSF